MPYDAGRSRMPHNNRMHSSTTLKMTGIWKNTIGYDPYAAPDEIEKSSGDAYEQSKGLMALAKMSSKDTEIRGACKKCGMVGHLTYQCRNYLLEEFKDQDSDLSSDISDSSQDEADKSDSGSDNFKQRKLSKKRKKEIQKIDKSISRRKLDRSQGEERNKSSRSKRRHRSNSRNSRDRKQKRHRNS